RSTMLFVTNLHVIEGTQSVHVGFLANGEPHLYSGETLHVSPARDLALLRLRPDEGGRLHLRSGGLQIATAEVPKGEDVAEIGFPSVPHISPAPA
ncbi:MAG: hypothetical protein OXC91_01005, partial [Rhodobacteraceae bacterium]|nr:hypothetical protein [Paracoccaceae bacterium]